MKKTLCMILAVALVLSFAGCAAGDYKKAAVAYEAGDFEQARSMFEALGDYRNSADLLTDCDYQLAKALYDSSDFAAAAPALEALGDYKDSAELLLAAKDELLKQVLVGNWLSAEIDATDLFMSGLSGSMAADVDIMSYIDLPPFKLQYTLEFTDKGTIVESVDDEVFEQTVDALTEKFSEGMTAYMEDAMKAEAEANGLTYEDLLAYYDVTTTEEFLAATLGMSMDEYVDLILGETLSAMTEMEENGTYTVENGEISLHTGSDTEIGTYDFEKEELTLTGEGAPKEQQDMYPIVFTKQ